MRKKTMIVWQNDRNMHTFLEKLDYYKDYWQCYFNSPTHGGWTSWAVDDDCTSRCPGSIKYFSRKCNSPRPKYCGNFCGEETLMLQRCPSM